MGCTKDKPDLNCTVCGMSCEQIEKKYNTIRTQLEAIKDSSMELTIYLNKEIDALRTMLERILTARDAFYESGGWEYTGITVHLNDLLEEELDKAREILNKKD
jgi:hypothetical protein